MILMLDGSKAGVVSKDGDIGKFRTGVSSRLHGNSMENSARGNCFSVSRADVVLGDISSTTPSFGIYNFCDSDRYVSLIRWELVITKAPVTPVIGAYLLGVSTARNGQDAAQGLGTRPIDTTLSVRPDSRVTSYLASFTLPATPTIYRPFTNHLAGAPSITVSQPSYFMEFNGTCLIAPGRVAILAQFGADGTAASVDTLVVWEEIPI